MADAEAVALLTAGTRTTSSQTTGFRQAMNYMELTVVLDITAASGTTPTLDVVIETFDYVSAKYGLVAAFPQKTGVGTDILKITANLGRVIRVRWTIGGTTPSFTFSVGGVFKTP